MNFLKELLISATNGFFGKLLLVLIGVGGGFTISKAVTSDNTQGTIMILTTFNFAVVCSMIGFFRNLNIFKEWAREQRQDEIRKLELENENLKLKFQLQEKQSKPDNDE